LELSVFLECFASHSASEKMLTFYDPNWGGPFAGVHRMHMDILYINSNAKEKK